jgi:hypothetical protein
MSQFAFLRSEWPAVFEAAGKTEAVVHADPRTACFQARRALELAVAWLYKHDAALRLPYQDSLSALIHNPSFKQLAGEVVSAFLNGVDAIAFASYHEGQPRMLDGLRHCLRDASELDPFALGNFPLSDYEERAPRLRYRLIGADVHSAPQDAQFPVQV